MKKENKKLVSFTLELSTIESLDEYSKTFGINKSRAVEDAIIEMIERNKEVYKLEILNQRISTFKELKSIGSISKDWLLKNILKIEDYEE